MFKYTCITPDTPIRKEVPMAQKPSVARLISDANLSVSGLAARSGVSVPTARRAVRGQEHTRLSTTAATKIAKALDTTVGGINWLSDLTNVGRPAGS